MRFLAAPWIGLFESGAWLRNAEHGNQCAARLAEAIDRLPGVRLAFPVQSNAVFVHAPDALLRGLSKKGWRFYTFIGGSARFMFAWDARFEAVELLARHMAELRSEERRVGIEGVSTCRSRWSPYN